MRFAAYYQKRELRRRGRPRHLALWSSAALDICRRPPHIRGSNFGRTILAWDLSYGSRRRSSPKIELSHRSCGAGSFCYACILEGRQPDDGGKDAFVHVSAIERAGLTGLREGQKISYEMVSDKRSGKMSADKLKAV